METLLVNNTDTSTRSLLNKHRAEKILSKPTDNQQLLSLRMFPAIKTLYMHTHALTQTHKHTFTRIARAARQAFTPTNAWCAPTCLNTRWQTQERGTITDVQNIRDPREALNNYQHISHQLDPSIFFKDASTMNKDHKIWMENVPRYESRKCQQVVKKTTTTTRGLVYVERTLSS